MEITPPEIWDYAERHSSPQSNLLYELYRDTHLKTLMPRMLSGHIQGKFLGMLARLSKAKTILEIGTFTGYSAIAMAEMTDAEVHIHTIEKNPEMENLIRHYFDKSGMSHRISLHMGAAADIIPKLNLTPDLVFIDADKQNYRHYYELLLPRMNKGGLIVADNALWDGKVLNNPAGDKETAGIADFNEAVQKDPRVENLLLPLRDGLMLIIKK